MLVVGFEASENNEHAFSISLFWFFPKEEAPFALFKEEVLHTLLKKISHQFLLQGRPHSPSSKAENIIIINNK